MIFVQYNDHGGKKVSFALDHVATWETLDEDATLVTLKSGRELELNIEFDVFIDAIFSDENMVDEYTNVIIHNQSTEPAAGDEFLSA